MVPSMRRSWLNCEGLYPAGTKVIRQKLLAQLPAGGEQFHRAEITWLLHHMASQGKLFLAALATVCPRRNPEQIARSGNIVCECCSRTEISLFGREFPYVTNTDYPDHIPCCARLGAG